MLFNCAAHFLFGALLGATARRSDAFRSDIVSWPLILLVAFHAIIAAPSATYLFRFYPQWSLHYGFDPQVFPGLAGWIGPLSGAVVMANLILGAMGLFMMRYAALRGSRALQVAVVALGALGWLVASFIYGQRALWVGTHDAYWQSQAPLIVESPAGWVGLGTYIAGTIFLVWIRRRFAQRDPQYV